MKITQPIPWKLLHGKCNVKNNENTHHKCFLTVKPIKWDKEKDKLVKSKPPAQGKTRSFDDQLYPLLGNEALEKFFYWTKDVWDKLVTKKPILEYI